MPARRCVILVGHGGVPKDCPPALVSEFKRLDAASRGRPTPELLAADAKVRAWPRDDSTDPYRAGLRAVAAALRERLPGRLVLEAYNEFCSPSLPEALAAAVSQGAADITVVTTMYTRGGIHSEVEIPQLLEALRREHPGVTVRYAWPFDLPAVGDFLAGAVLRAEESAVR